MIIYKELSSISGQHKIRERLDVNNDSKSRH